MPQAGPKGFVARESANQIARKFDEIVEFSGCARYIDTPVTQAAWQLLGRLPQAARRVRSLGKIRFEIENQSEILNIMSYEELKKEVVALSFKEQKELSALLFSLWRKNNSQESSSLERRVQDRDERNWVSLEDFAIRTKGQGA